MKFDKNRFLSFSLIQEFQFDVVNQLISMGLRLALHFNFEGVFMLRAIAMSTVVAAFSIGLSAFASFAGSPIYESGKAGQKEAQSYTKVKNVSSRYLSYRDLGPWLSKVQGKAALDYGSGLGFSTEFLVDRGFEVKGADINPNMIIQAKNSYPGVDFTLIKDDKLPFANLSFDLVFSSLVLFELSSLQQIENYLKEARRVLREDGYFIGITGSSSMHDPNYKSELRKTDYPQNKGAKSGSLVKVTLNEINLTFEDYLWFEKDYRKIFQKAGLPICEVHYPLGQKDEPYPWKDELNRSPFILILARKSCTKMSP